MTIGGMIAVAFLAIMVVLILRGIRGHQRRGGEAGGLDRIGYGGGDQADGHGHGGGGGGGD
jgi:hypothetical protein